MPARGRGQYQRSGQSKLRTRYNVLKAVRRYRGQAAPSWEQYKRTTQGGRTEYRGGKKP